VLDEFASGVIVVLDPVSDEGALLIRDDASYELVQQTLARLAAVGWHEVDPDDAVVPYEFPGGALGVKTYLYKVQDAQEVN
jgi:hypothetical protein